jgi:hypothetical protein
MTRALISGVVGTHTPDTVSLVMSSPLTGAQIQAPNFSFESATLEFDPKFRQASRLPPNKSNDLGSWCVSVPDRHDRRVLVPRRLGD